MDGREIRRFPRDRHVVYNRQHSFRADTLHHLLIHGDGGRQHAGADVRNVRQFEQALHRAVFAEGAVKHREDYVDFGLGARLGQDGLGQPLALLIDKVLDFFVLLGVHPVQDGPRGADRHFVLAAAAAINDGYT